MPKIILTVVLMITNQPNDFASPIAQPVALFPAPQDPELYLTLIQCRPVQPCLSEATKQGEFIRFQCVQKGRMLKGNMLKGCMLKGNMLKAKRAKK